MVSLSLRQPIFPIHVSVRFGDWVSVCNHYRALVFTQCVCECKCVQYENSLKNFKRNSKNTEIFHEIFHEQKNMFLNISTRYPILLRLHGGHPCLKLLILTLSELPYYVSSAAAELISRRRIICIRHYVGNTPSSIDQDRLDRLEAQADIIQTSYKCI